MISAIYACLTASRRGTRVPPPTLRINTGFVNFPFARTLKRATCFVLPQVLRTSAEGRALSSKRCLGLRWMTEVDVLSIVTGSIKFGPRAIPGVLPALAFADSCERTGHPQRSAGRNDVSTMSIWPSDRIRSLAAGAAGHFDNTALPARHTK